MENVVEVRNLSKIYKKKRIIPGLFNTAFAARSNGRSETKAVNKINIHIKRGEFFGLLAYISHSQI
jgi:ABC-type multidrug transport system ATPase subunit